MRNQHPTIAVTLLVLAGSALAPAMAVAGSLLSGYGGPGQGNQAILGSALLNGPSGGGGAGGRGSGGGGAGGVGGGGAPVGGARDEAAARARGSGAPAGPQASGPSGGQKHANGSSGNASGGGFRPYTRTSNQTASQGSSGGSQTLGLSGADLVYILLALGVLVLTGVLTRKLVRQPVWGRDAS
jgi:hypothetical protein